ncbi:MULTISPECIES: MFS transporter [Catenuloplanes]|uniref:EmrB/QacA subfamily drug resistance transporter n=1 Tax=Catenuloplanes niger TaxID=587534 RepID=A0AAE4CXX5_9ACTN|nr:MFS transporter [Catenuloplanes niger]MDR7327058.1 EmrB/QacA subfamily drug resistance transporter [Catenuloplanes niger]
MGLPLLVLLCTAHFMDAIDLSDVTVALPAIQADLGLGAGALGWVVAAYLLGYGGFLLLGGRVADVWGARRVLLVATAVFLAAGAVGTFAPDGATLIAARLVKGVAAAFLAPASLALISTRWPEGPARGKALGAYATAGAAGFVGGLVLGGAVTEVSWRLAMALPLPFAVAVLLLAPRLIPRGGPVTREPLDLTGAVLATGGFSALVLALTTGPQLGWAGPVTLVTAVAAVLALVGFVLRERHAPAPLLPLDYLAGRTAAGSALAIACLWAAYSGFAFLATLAFQNVLGWSPLQAALAFAPIGLVNGVLAPQAGKLASRIGVRPMVVGGMVLLTLSYALFFRLEPGAGFVSVVLPVMAVNGVGIAATFAPLNMAALGAAPAGRQGLAASVLGAAQQIGGAVGLAAVTAGVHGAGLTGYTFATALIVAVSAAGVLCALVLRTR